MSSRTINLKNVRNETQNSQNELTGNTTANISASLSSLDSTVIPPMPNDTKQMMETLMVRNAMLMQLLKVQQEKPTNEVMLAPDFQKSILIHIVD